MSNRTVPFDVDEVCDICGVLGAYDFMGDLICPACVDKFSVEEGGNEDDFGDELDEDYVAFSKENE